MFIIFSTLLHLLSTAEANPTTQIRLGAVKVADRTDRDVIHLPACDGINNIPVNSIRLQVNNKPVQIDRVKVVFHNNQEQTLGVKKHMKIGEKSPWLDLKGNARCIKKIVFVGDADTKRVNSKKQSTVVVVGKVRNNNAVRPAEKNTHTLPQDNQGTTVHKLMRVQLGEETKRETAFLPSCKTDDNVRVSQVRIVVKKHPAEINRVRVQFQNGTEQSFKVNKHLAVDEVSPWVDLQGGNRCIQSISFVGDADTLGFRPNARSVIVVQGR